MLNMGRKCLKLPGKVYICIMFQTDLDVVSFMEDAGLPKESSGEAAMHIEQVRDGIRVLSQTRREQHTLELVREEGQEIVHEGTFQHVHLPRR